MSGAQKKMRPFRGLIPLEEAVARVLSAVHPIGRTEDISLLDATSRISAEDVSADFDVPGFSRAAMDGYAVIAEETFGAGQFNPAKLKLAGTIYAGGRADAKVTGGCCIQVATGAKLPDGANAVVKVEDTESSNEGILVFKPVYPLQNVSGAKSDMAKGTLAIKKGDALPPAKVGVLAALGRKSAEVYEKPKIAIVPTGDEIAKPGTSLDDAQVYDINSYSLSSLVSESGGIPVLSSIKKDDEKTLKDAIISATTECDAVLLSGGSSVGDRDLLHDIIGKLGEVIFHGVQIKPGKPTLFGIVNGKPVFGMPGYPTSCLTNGYLFLVPAIRKMARRDEGNVRYADAKLSRRVVSTLGRHQILTVKIDNPNDGETLLAHPVFKESGAITSMAHSDGYIEIPHNVDLLESGDAVRVRLW